MRAATPPYSLKKKGKEKTMEKFIKKLMIKKLIKKGYEYYTITVDGEVQMYVFNK